VCIGFHHQSIFDNQPTIPTDVSRFAQRTMMPRLLIFLSLAISSFAAPTPASSRAAQQVANSNTDAQTTSGSQTYILSLKPNTVDPDARGEWLNTVLSINNHTRRDLSSTSTGSDLRLTWSEHVFNGIAGSFSEAEVEMLRSLDEVKYIQPGSLPRQLLNRTMHANPISTGRK
jgi:hypothetical protein